MTAAELISKLSEMDPNLEVGLYIRVGSDDWTLTPVTDAKLIDDEMQPRMIQIDYDPNVEYEANEDGVVDLSRIKGI